MMKVKKFKRITRPITTGKNISETIIVDDDERFKSSDYIWTDRLQSLKFTERQENFYQNLLQLYKLTKSKQLPVFFVDGEGNKWRLDKGCVAMAVYDGFISKLKNNSSGFVEIVTLNW